MDVTTIVTPSNVKTIKSNLESTGVKSNGDVVEPKTIRKNSFRPPVIEDWNSDDAMWNNTSRVNHKNFTNKMTHPHPNRRFVPQAVLTKSGKINTAGASVNTAVRPVNTAGSKPTGNPHQNEYKEKGVIDSGCSRHMTGNKLYLTKYEDYDGGFVSFGDGKGRISGKVQVKDNEDQEGSILVSRTRRTQKTSSAFGSAMENFILFNRCDDTSLTRGGDTGYSGAVARDAHTKIIEDSVRPWLLCLVKWRERHVQGLKTSRWVGSKEELESSHALVGSTD
ncbi:hypothetical protein Tco_0159087 [Tanacetum coccineum]